MLKLPSGWSKKNEKLLLVLKCDDFTHALALLNSVADIAEKRQHHPDIAIRNYNELLVSTTSHDAGKLTEKDYGLAQEISDLLDYQSEKQDIETNGRKLGA
jgi:4a-hydroxytetrahydrobiopterin dehydratase